jgi:hypothetical protein
MQGNIAAFLQLVDKHHIHGRIPLVLDENKSGYSVWSLATRVCGPFPEHQGTRFKSGVCSLMVTDRPIETPFTLRPKARMLAKIKVRLSSRALELAAASRRLHVWVLSQQFKLKFRMRAATERVLVRIAHCPATLLAVALSAFTFFANTFSTIDNGDSFHLARAGILGGALALVLSLSIISPLLTHRTCQYLKQKLLLGSILNGGRDRD